MTDYKKLKNQPLIYVLAEFRFSQIMKIEDYIPSFHEVLRKRYPTPQAKSEQTVFVKSDGVSVSNLGRWSFTSADNRNAIDLNQDRVMFYTSDYDRFNGFSERCKETIDALIKIVEPSLVSRIGLRYGDLITVTDEHNLEELVDPHFLYPSTINRLGRPKQQRNEIFLSTDIGGLLIRTLYGQHNLVCLPDIQGLSITLDNDKESSERIILDFDHFWEAKGESVTFNSDFIMETLGSLHKTSREAFWNITTSKARDEIWA